MFVKRGLSGVVTTLIIVLLVLVAIGVIWVVVRNVIDKGTEQIELGQFSLDLQIKKVQVQNGNVTVIVVRRNPGDGNFVGMNFVFSDGQNSETIRQNVSLQELDEKTFTFTLTKISTSNLKTVSVAPIYELSSGKETAGNTVTTFDVPKSGTGTGTGAATSGGNFAMYGPVGVGLADYSVDSLPEVLPRFTRIIIDPLDVHVGDNQTFMAYVTSSYNITEVTTRTQLDNDLLVLPLQKISEGVYSATWQVYDTHTQVYRTNFTAKDSGGNQNTITMSWTDPCIDFVHGTTSTVDQACPISTIDGVDQGNIIIATGGSITIDSGAYLVYGPGFSISKTGSGAIIKLSGGTITKQYLYYYDSDGDTRANNGTYLMSTAPSSSPPFQRAKDVVSTSDCNDGNSSLYATGYGANYDNDGYGLAGASGCNNGPNPFNATTGGNDCDDANITVWGNGYGYDSDGDGWGLASVSGCYNGANPRDATTGGDDCDDTNAGIHTNPGSCTLDGDCCPGYSCGGSQCQAA